MKHLRPLLIPLTLALALAITPASAEEEVEIPVTPAETTQTPAPEADTPTPQTDRNIIASGTCGKDGDNLTWALDDAGLLTIDGTGEMADYVYVAENWQWILLDRPWDDYIDFINTIIIGDEVTSTGAGAFEKCKSLEEVDLGRKVKTIAEDSFSYCPKLTTISLPDALDNLVDISMGFRDSNYSIIKVPSTVTSIAFFLYEQNSLTEFICEESEYIGGVGYFDDDGILYKKDLSTGYQGLIKCPRNKPVEEYTVLDGTTSIGNRSFSYIKTLTEVHIPETVTRIDWYAFQGCENLTEINIPESVKNIGMYAFDNCKKLTEVHIPESVKIIEDGAFANCDNLTGAYFYGDAPKLTGKKVWIGDKYVPGYSFGSPRDTFTVYYIEGKSGWTTPIWPADDPEQPELHGYNTATFTPAPSPEPIPGDANADGILNSKDVTYLRRYLTGGFNADTIDLDTADLNHDGIVNGKDITLLRRMITEN